MKFQIVDAFTRQTFGGNPAGVVLLPEGADFLSLIHISEPTRH